MKAHYALLNKKDLQFRPNGGEKISANSLTVSEHKGTLRKTGILAGQKFLADLIAILMCSITSFNQDHIFSLGLLFSLLRCGPISTVYLKLQTVSCLIHEK